MPTVVPPTLDRWFKNPNNAVQLAEALENPAVQQAIALLRDAAQPNNSFVQSTDEVTNNNRLCWLAGYCDFARDLQKLTQPRKTKPQATPDEWTHIQ